MIIHAVVKLIVTLIMIRILRSADQKLRSFTQGVVDWELLFRIPHFAIRIFVSS